MKLSEISPPPPCKRSKRAHYKSAERGGFTFDMGTIAFGNPLDLIGKSAKARQRSRDHWKEIGSKKAKKSEQSDYHRKHG